MKKLKLFIAALALLGGVNLANAQTDVTSTYLTNADFEGTYTSVCTINTDRYVYQPNGWTVDYVNKSTWNMTVVSSNDAMASNFTGTYAVPSDNQKYMVRFRDNQPTEYVDLSQTITINTTGFYVFSADMIREDGSKINVELYAGSNSVSNSTGGTWENRSFSVSLEANTEIKVGIKFTNVGAGGHKAGADNVKITYFNSKDDYLRYINDLTDATAASPVVTNFVVNGTFTDNVNGWNRTGDFQNSARANNQNGAFTVPFWENWNQSAKVNKMYQTISNIPNGTYRLDIAAFVNTLADPNESQYVFANSDKTYLTTGEPTAYEVYTVVTNNQIEIGLEQTTATANWMGIDNVSLRYYGAGDVINDAKNAAHKLAWEEAKVAAEAALANTDYANVTGLEKSALQTEIAKAEPSTADDYDNAANALTTATQNFVNAKTNYDIFATYNTTLAYADADKKPTVTSESTAATILPALRAYYESNALAEGVEGAENKTDLISDPNMEVTYNSTEHTFGAWQVFSQVDGNIQLLSNESFTDGDGNSNYKYADIWKSDNNAGIQQTISNLPAGKYMLTVTARANTTANATFWVFAGNQSAAIQRIGNTGGVFDRGWNDTSVEFTLSETSDVNIGVQSGNGRDLWWSATRFRLVKLSDVISENATTAPKPSDNANVILYRTLSSGYWNTFSVPFNMEKPDGWEVKEFDSATDNVINFKDAESIVAGNPYLVKPASDVTEPMVFNGVTVSSEAVTKGEGNYKFAAQLFHDTSLPIDGTIAYLSTDGTIKKLTSGGIKGLRAYFIIPAGSNARIAFTDGDQTGIMDTVRETTNDNRVYDLQGRQVKAVKKGIYVVNGKKVIK